MVMYRHLLNYAKLATGKAVSASYYAIAGQCDKTKGKYLAEDIFTG
jgi:hypothetical protein